MPRSADVVLELEDVGWVTSGITIVSGVSLQVRTGELISVIGPNGAGKTSLVNIISGLLPATSGVVTLRGMDITGASPDRRARAGLGRSFQTSSIFEGLTVFENARLAVQARRGGAGNLWKRPRAARGTTGEAMEALEAVGLTGRSATKAGALSHGEKRKLEIALLLCADASVLLLDEPTAGAATEDVGPMMAVVTQLQERDKTVVMVEHRMELVTSMSDRVAVMHEGKLLTCATPQEVMADPTVREAYLGAEW